MQRTLLDARMASSRLIGVLFLAGFLFYGTGSGIATAVVDAPDVLSAIAAQKTALAWGVILMFLNTAVDIGKGVVFYPIIAPHGKRTALIYLSALIVQVVLMDVGGLFLLMLVPLGAHAAEAGPATVTWAMSLSPLLIEANTLAYHMGQAALSVGAAFLCALLYRTALVPRWLAGWGFAGYVIHCAGSMAELLGVPISLVLLIPGGLFEVVFAIWLLIRGFEPAVYEQTMRLRVGAPVDSGG